MMTPTIKKIINENVSNVIHIIPIGNHTLKRHYVFLIESDITKYEHITKTNKQTQLYASASTHLQNDQVHHLDIHRCAHSFLAVPPLASIASRCMPDQILWF